jgi:hypothetical protein
VYGKIGGEGVGGSSRYLWYTPHSEKRKMEMEQLKRGRGRPKGSVKMTIQRFADNPPAVLPKTDHQRLKELKELMIRSGGKDVAQKVIEIALNDDHPHQLVALKMCLDRTLPVSMFEKDKSQRSAVTINITGLGEPTVIDTNAEDVEAKYG